MAVKPQSSRNSYHVGNLSAQLLSTARTMLEEVGSTRLSLRALCTQLGVTPTAAYHHFTNRAQLLSQLATQGYQELAQVLDAAGATLAVHDKLRGFCLTYLGFARDNPELYQLMFGSELTQENMPDTLREARQLAFSKLETMVAEVLQLPSNSADVRSAALASWSYLHGLTALLQHRVLERPAEVSDQRIIERTLAGFEVLFKDHTAAINSVLKLPEQGVDMPKKSPVVIEFSTTETAFATILIARSERGVCTVLLGDTPAELYADLQQRLPKAELVQNDQELAAALKNITDFLTKPLTPFDFPVDIQGSDFQKSVWAVLQSIPVGQTLNYSEVAERLHKPKAVRAVANACAKNPLALVIPCHRVLRADGGISGYRWGVERKRELLEKEQQARQQ